MAKLRGAIASTLASAALLVGSCAGVAVAAASADVASAGQQPGSSDAGGTTLVTVGGDTPLKVPAPGAVGGAKVQPPVVLETLNVDPGESRAGGSVDLRTFADCGGTSTGEVRSAAFAAPVGLALAADGGLYAAARIAPNTKPGTYLVHEFCAGHPVAAGKLTIAELGAPATGGGWRALHADAAPGTAQGAAGRTASAASPLLRDAAVGLTLASIAAYGALVLRRGRAHAAGAAGSGGTAGLIGPTDRAAVAARAAAAATADADA
ncbi:hypothetical protein ABIA32_004489 [Streptacidiphilus sp. MAP12-20]|uniref:hypothetical protein n=1 Tax=Streptacidiphilus sp. MAP12-20 TaxID=3156299 RepID=UPI003518B945